MALDTLTKSLLTYNHEWFRAGRANKELPMHSHRTYIHDCEVIELRVKAFVVSISNDDEAPKVVRFFESLKDLVLSNAENFCKDDFEGMKEAADKTNRWIYYFTIYVNDLIAANKTNHAENVSSKPVDEYAEFCKRYAKKY